MKRLLMIITLLASMSSFGQTRELQIHNFVDIPTELLAHIEKMGIDTLSVLNEYEGRYLNFIFKVDSQYFDLVGARVGFLKSKEDYFKETRERFYNGSTTVGGSALYIFDANQKQDSGGYDAAIVYWSKILMPTEKVVKSLKGRS
jgi:hypothetical protein